MRNSAAALAIVVGALAAGCGRETADAPQVSREQGTDPATARVNAGQMLYEKRELEASVLEFRAALELKPDFAPAQRGLGFALGDLGRTHEAAVCLRAVVASDPSDQKALLELIEVLALAEQARKRNGDEAAALADQLLARTPKPDIDSLFACAAAYGQAGQWQRAVDLTNDAYAQLQAAGDQPRADEAHRRLMMFMTKQPLRREE